MIHEIECLKTTAGASGTWTGPCERCTMLLEFDGDSIRPSQPLRPDDGGDWYVIGSGCIRGWGGLDGPCYVVKGDGLLTEYYVPEAAWNAAMPG